MNFRFIANAALGVGEGVSGGDRIFIELARRWAKHANVTIYLWEEGREMCRRSDLDGVEYVVWPAARYKWLGFPIHFFIRTAIGRAKARKLKSETADVNVIYSASDFWPDALPALKMKKTLRNSRLIGGFYMFAANPLKKGSPYKGFARVKGLVHFLMQRPVIAGYRKNADMVFVTNEGDAAPFISERLGPERVVAVHGGIDAKLIASVPEPREKKYDAVFVGRLVWYKGVLELADIWRLVCKGKSDAKLAVLGNGPLETNFREKVQQYGLENNIELLGFIDGQEKIEVFKSSRVVVHPSVYDSGGMAACEAMACGLPGVCFDLETLKTYYPKGMIKAPENDLGAFAESILKLLSDDKLYSMTRVDAIALAGLWDWDKRAEDILAAITRELVGG